MKPRPQFSEAVSPAQITRPVKSQTMSSQTDDIQALKAKIARLKAELEVEREQSASRLEVVRQQSISRINKLEQKVTNLEIEKRLSAGKLDNQAFQFAKL